MTNLPGGRSNSIRGHLCRSMCRIYVRMDRDQDCEKCTRAAECEAQVDEILAFVDAQRIEHEEI